MVRIRVETPGPKAAVHAALAAGVVHASKLVGYRGARRVARYLGRIFGNTEVTVEVAPGKAMHLPLRDGYWIRLLSGGYQYEPEVRSVLDRMITSDTYFIDCGANIGYWSVLYSTRARALVAIEANPFVHQRLIKNLALNNSPAIAIQAAVWRTDQERLVLRVHEDRHAASSIGRAADQPGGGWAEVTVESVTLEAIVERHCPSATAPIVVKLDIEGAEVPALDGATAILEERNVVIVYEDHGSDPTHAVTRKLLELGLNITDPATGDSLSLADISSRKTEPWRGYNFLAHRAQLEPPNRGDWWPSSQI